MTRLDRDAIGFVIGAVGIVFCVVLAYAFGLIRQHGPALREFALWLLGDLRFYVGFGVALALIMGGTAVIAFADSRGAR